MIGINEKVEMKMLRHDIKRSISSIKLILNGKYDSQHKN